MATNDLPGAFALNQLTFNHPSGAITLDASAGGSLDFSGANPTMSIDGAGSASVSMPIRLSGPTTIQGSGIGSLSLTGPITTPTGSASPGSLTVNTSGVVTLSGGGTFNDGTTASTGGFVQVLGGTLNLNGGSYTANYPDGANDHASLAIDNGTAANPTQFHISNQATFTGRSVQFGKLANGNVIATIDGPGTSVTAQESLFVAARTATAADVTVRNGGTLSQLSSNGTTIGQSASAQGTLTVSGVSASGVRSTFLSNGFLYLGGILSTSTDTVGNLRVMDGGFAHVSAFGSSGGHVFLAPFASTSAGNILVTGISGGANPVPSQLVIDGQLQAGGGGGTAGGSGNVRVGSGGIIQVRSYFWMYPGGSANVDAGGTLDVFGIVDAITGPQPGNISTQAGGVIAITGEGSNNNVGYYTGIISGGGSVVRNGVNTQFLLGINTYTGGTTIDRGALTVNGQISGPVVVNNGGTLFGGSVSGSVGRVAGSVTLNSGGTLATGDGLNSLSTSVFNITGSITMNAGANLKFHINGATPGSSGGNHGQIDLTGGGSIALGNGVTNLVVSANTTALNAATTITLIQGGTVSGTFAGLPNGTTFNIPNAASTTNPYYSTTIFYNPMSVVLSGFTPVPEPLHILAFGGLAAGAFGWWKRQK
jgi:autotransporter-associated beta strand protein